ncbi:hypothetical protein CDL12_09522 [Handroanthus impetiginosus]|uniref:Uncharacterized protein n=1 Tax=Handroanthus impetiginosus TaxID=429701 RepID=A0A2G9HJW2_9LAMI|nr:hypothetical protein CDL12_09522 [Handroanthus impetiginosus]
MKRQGRQHGVVRTYPTLSDPWNPRPKPRNLNRLTSPPTAGLFTKVSSKPTNHSKFTGKCGRAKCHDCHIHPACKSKDKVKGAHKIRSSSDVESNHRLITWRVVDASPGLKLSGFSASGVLDFLSNNDDIDCGYEDDYNDDDDDLEIEEAAGYDVKNEGVKDEDEDDRMSFCEVGFIWQPVDGDESWCLVEEM